MMFRALMSGPRVLGTAAFPRLLSSKPYSTGIPLTSPTPSALLDRLSAFPDTCSNGEVEAIVQDVDLMTLMNARLLAQQRRVNVGVVERTLKDVLAQRLLLGGGDNEEGRGLQLKRVTHSWAASNPHVMDQLIKHEILYELSNPAFVQHRLGMSDDGMRVYALTHPDAQNGNMLLAVLFVALCGALEGVVQNILIPERRLQSSSGPEAALAKSSVISCPSHAMFYSILSPYPQLSGLSLGPELIHRTTDVLRREFDCLRVFSTLSPIPGFATYLLDLLKTDSGAEMAGFSLSDAAYVRCCAKDGRHEVGGYRPWLQRILFRQCAHYLACEKDKRGRALNSVANFHLSNGATMHRINVDGDLSPDGMKRSLGFLVNYLYLDLSLPNADAELEKQKASYNSTGYIKLGDAVAELLEKR